MKTKTTKSAIDEINDAIGNKAKDPSVLSSGYVSRTFLEPYGYSADKEFLSTTFISARVEKVKDTNYANASGEITFGGEGHPATLYFSAYEPEDIDTEFSKLDTLESEVLDFCAKMREALETYRVLSKVKEQK